MPRGADSASQSETHRLGPYELIAEIARGGMARVFLARRQGEAGFERLFAIKLMHDHLNNEQEAVTMLIDEARLASRLHHPNVVPIVDIGNEGGSYYLAMDYVEGCSLADLLKKSKHRRPPELIVPLVLDSLHGLHAAHEIKDADGASIGLIHRDFSPQNLMIGVDGICRVTDFGVAKAASRLTHTRSTIQKGKIAYMSPEQLEAQEVIDRRVDIWAAGVVLWYALTGEHPFRGKSEAATIHMIISRELPKPSSVGFKPPECFDDILGKALSRDRDARFATAQEMADQLQRVAMKSDLHATQSEVATWVLGSFERDLEERRATIRQLGEQGGEITWSSAPSLPRFAVTPSSGFSRSSLRLSIASPEHTPAPTSPSVEPQTPAPLKPRPKRPPQSSQRRALWGMLGGIGAGFVVCLGLIFALIGPHDSEEDEPQRLASAPPTTEVAAPAAEEPAPAERPAARPPSSSDDEEEATSQPAAIPDEQGSEEQASATEDETVTITLEGVPEDVRIRVDGIVVDQTEFTFPRDGRERVIRVDKPGFTQWVEAVIPRRDRTYQVSIRRSRGRRERSRTKSGSNLIRDPGF